MKWMTILTLMVWSNIASAQKLDYNWISGIRDNPETSKISWGTILNITPEDRQVDKLTLPIYMRRTPVTISDKNGDLLFYTNGNVMVNKHHQIMENGKGFNEGSSWSDYGTNLERNSPYRDHCYMIVPDDDQNGIYYMIHSLINYNVKYLNRSDKIQISKIDVTANNGRGKVIYKNKTLIQDTSAYAFELIRHANGKNWWLVYNNLPSDTINTVLLEGDKIIEHQKHMIPTFDTSHWIFEDYYYQSHYIQTNPAGNRIINEFGRHIKRIFEFDRCSGDIQLIDTFHTGIDTFYQDGRPTLWGPIGAYNFSPSGRYLYGTSPTGTYRYDLEADVIGASRTQIGGIPFALSDTFGPANGVTILPPNTLGPDGKLYILGQFTHRVIEHPDDPSDNSGYCEAPCIDFTGVYGPSDDPNPEIWSNNYPNYRLGALEGSPCDTIVSSSEELAVSEIKVFPNPASSQITIDITTPQWAHEGVHIRVYDVLGRQVHSHQMTPYSYLHRIDIRSWAEGIYMVHLMQGEQSVAVEKVIKR